MAAFVTTSEKPRIGPMVASLPPCHESIIITLSPRFRQQRSNVQAASYTNELMLTTCSFRVYLASEVDKGGATPPTASKIIPTSSIKTSILTPSA